MKDIDRYNKWFFCFFLRRHQSQILSNKKKASQTFTNK